MFSLFYSIFTSEYVYAVFMLFPFFERMCLRCSWFFHERICLRCFYVIFLERMCLRCLWYFHERICLRCFYVSFLERMCLRCLWYFHNRICLRCFLLFFLERMCLRFFLVLLRANMFALFHVIFLKRRCLRCLWYFHERMYFRCVYAVYGTFTSEYVFAVCLFFFPRANVLTLFMIHSRANMFIMFFPSGCVYAGLYVAFLLANMFPLFMAPL